MINTSKGYTLERFLELSELAENWLDEIYLHKDYSSGSPPKIIDVDAGSWLTEEQEKKQFHDLLLSIVENHRSYESYALEFSPLIAGCDASSTNFAEFITNDSTGSYLDVTAHQIANSIFVNYISDIFSLDSFESSSLDITDGCELTDSFFEKNHEEICKRNTNFCKDWISENVTKLCFRIYRERSLVLVRYGHVSKTPKLVTIANVSMMVGLEEKSMGKYTKNWPKPSVRRRGRAPAKFRYSELYLILIKQFPDIKNELPVPT
jgi:hypothetical protein